MHDDLQDAFAAIAWAVAQIPTLEQRIKAWIDSDPCEFVAEEDPTVGKKLIKLRVRSPLPLIISAETGAIVNSLRASLDLLAATLASRNGSVSLAVPTPQPYNGRSGHGAA